MLPMSRMSIWSIYILIFLLIILGVIFAYYSNENNKILTEQKKALVQKELESPIVPSVDNSSTETNPVVADDSSKENPVSEDDWRSVYPNTKSMKIASTTVEASIASSWADRIKGLSDTPYLPEEVVKLFIFDSAGLHSIWMKDMNYSIDIIWVDENNKIVDIKESASPDSYPESFSPKEPAKYVIETKAGFVERKGVKIGDKIATD